MRPIIKAVNECEEALQARSQQGTWGPKSLHFGCVDLRTLFKT